MVTARDCNRRRGTKSLPISVKLPSETPYLGAAPSLASMAASSPMAVWTVTTRVFCVRGYSLLGGGGWLGFGHTGVLLLLNEELGNLGPGVALGHADVILDVTIAVHQAEEAIVRDVDLTGRVSLPELLLRALLSTLQHTSVYSVRLTWGTSMLWVEGERSSSFLPVKMSMATRWTLAWPCLPVLEVDMSTILQGRFLITTCPFFRRAEHCMG